MLGVHVISMGFACDIDVCTISTVGSGIARQCEADGLARPTAVVCVIAIISTAIHDTHTGLLGRRRGGPASGDP